MGHITWLGFDHYASRPVVPVARTDAEGSPYTQFMSFGAADDPALHSHMLVPSVVMTDTGRVGSLDLDTMAGKTHSWSAFYQAFLATNLKRLGVEVGLDERTGAARLAAVPEDVRDAFSKRTKLESEQNCHGHGPGFDGVGLCRPSAPRGSTMGVNLGPTQYLRHQSLLHNRLWKRRDGVFWCASVLTGWATRDSIIALPRHGSSDGAPLSHTGTTSGLFAPNRHGGLAA